MQQSTDPYLVLGVVLPDMVKNHRKNWNLHPSRQETRLLDSGIMASIYRGWELHMETDRHFHSSSFFKDHSSSLRKKIGNIITRPPFRPFFLAHVAIELLLDSLLIAHQKVDTSRFYLHLSRCHPAEITRFLGINKVMDPASFITWLNRFTESAYLYAYHNAGSLAYALNQIGQRVWITGFSNQEKEKLATLLSAYKTGLQDQYLEIFEEVNEKLKL